MCRLNDADDRAQVKPQIVPVQLRCKQARHVAVEIKRIRQAESVFEKAGKIMEIYRLVRDDEHGDIPCGVCSDAVANKFRGAAWDQARVQRMSLNKQWSRLAGKVAAAALRGKLAAFDHMGAAIFQAKDPIGQHPEIARSGARDKRAVARAAFYIKTDRSPVAMIHPGIHRKAKAQALRGKLGLDPVKLAIGLPVRGAIKQAQILAGRVYNTQGIGGAAKLLGAALKTGGA